MPGDINNWPELKSLKSFANNIALFTKFAGRFFIITKDDRVYVYGNQTIGPVDTNACFDTSLQPKEITGLRGKQIIKFSFSSSEVLALSVQGKIWVVKLIWGDQAFSSKPVQISKPSDVFDIVSSSVAHFALTRNGLVYHYASIVPNIDNVIRIDTTFEGTGFAFFNNTKLGVLNYTDNSCSQNILELPISPTSAATTYSQLYILGYGGAIYVYDSANGLRIFYDGPIKFKQIFADQLSYPSYLIGQTKDNQLYVLKKKGESTKNITLRLLFTNDIALAFARDRPNGLLPFMVSLGIRNPKRCSHNMDNVFNNKTLSDTTFIVGNKKIYAQRAVLRSFSNYMLFQFNGAWSAESTIKITKYNYHIYYLYIRYIMTGNLDISAEDALDLFVVASNNKEDKLKEKLKTIIFPLT